LWFLPIQGKAHFSRYGQKKFLLRPLNFQGVVFAGPPVSVILEKAVFQNSRPTLFYPVQAFRRLLQKLKIVAFLEVIFRQGSPPECPPGAV